MLRIPLCDLLGIELQIIQKGKASVPHVLRRPRARGAWMTRLSCVRTSCSLSNPVRVESRGSRENHASGWPEPLR